MAAQWKVPTLIPSPRLAAITERQADVLAGITFGHSNREIGARLGITEDTVKRHASLLFRALRARDRAHAAALAASGQLTIVVRGVR